MSDESTRTQRILVVEDEESLAEGILENLLLDGYEAEVAPDGDQALVRIVEGGWDLVLLDVMLPGVDGFTICERTRAAGDQVPILFLTAKGGEDDRIRGLEAGGDDYLAKPFALRELLLRVAAILRRKQWYAGPPEGSAQSTTLDFGGSEVDFKTYRGRAWDGSEQQLTHKEALILKCLSDRAGEVVSREEILEQVWGYEIYPSTRTIDNFIVRLRKRFEREPDAPRHFHTQRGVGYRFTLDEETRPESSMKPLLLRALHGEPTDRRPTWIMRQAGRFLPEYRALKERYTFEELCADPALAAEVTMMPLKRFDFDAAITFADLITPASALGVKFKFDPGPVIADPIDTPGEIRALTVPSGPEIAPEVAAAQRLIKPQLKPDQALLGFAGAPFSLAAYLVEGRGKQGFPLLRAMLAEDPVVFGELMHKIALLSARYLVEQHKAGCDAVQVFDSWGGLLSLADWCVHVKPHIVDLLTHLRDAGVPTIFFANDAPHLAREMADLPSDGLALCWRNDLVAMRAELGEHTGPNAETGTKALQAALDPAILLAGPEKTAAAAKAFIAAMPRRGHIFNLGHGIMPGAPLESVAALIETLRAEAGSPEVSA